jgi:CRISPR-associated endonuclease/helicase Cas3
MQNLNVSFEPTPVSLLKTVTEQLPGAHAWGKLNRDGPELRTHSLIDHMLDVAACFTALAECAAIRRAMHRTAQRVLDEADIARLSALAFLHDIGKANSGFQSRRWVAPERPPWHWPTSPYGHGPEGWALVTGSIGQLAEEVLAGLPLNELASWGDEETSALLQASISHHGRPVGDEPSKQVAHIWQAVRSDQGAVLYDPAATVADMGDHLQRCFPLAFTPCQRPLPGSPAFVHLFAGLIQLADWLGSDTRWGFFEYSAPGENRCHTPPRRAAHAVRAIGLTVEPWRRALVEAAPTFEAAFNVIAPRPMQTATADPALGPLVILEAETGSGKTEAALWRFAYLFQAGLVDSLFFALPTRVAASQLYERIRDFVARLWPVNAPVVVRALPGYEAADGQAKISLPDFKVLWPDNPCDEVAHRRWVAESPKRFLAATIAVGTIDQALLGALQVRHAHLRHALLSRSMLVVDEVHASDAYMTVLLEQLLKAHLQTGGQALLLSATLGAAARTRYLNIGQLHNPSPVPALGDACGLAYPAISHRTASGVQLQGVEGNPRHKTVYWQSLDAIDAPDRVAALAVDAAARGARVLVVRNTVPAAVATLMAVEALNAAHGGNWLFTVGGVSTLHHSRFSRQDRPLLDKAVAAHFGKHRATHAGRIIVGTQTLEQSLDIDADLLITDLCPMDVLLQRVGRLHRHARPEAERPEDFRVARAWVLTPAGQDLTPMLKRSRNGLGRMRAGGGVYPDLRILEATRQLIQAQPSRTIPAENRALVELATHPEALLAIEASLGEEWLKVGQAIEGDTGAQHGLAHLHAIPYDEPFASTSFPESDQKIATRLGAADRLVEFTPSWPGPFGQEVKQLALRFHQVPAGLSPDAKPSEITALLGGAGLEFALGTARYRYSRLGLERLKADDPPRPTSGETA